MFVEVSRYKTYMRVRILRKVPIPGGTSKRVLVEHIGSARSEPELAILRIRAEQRMAELLPQLSLLAGIDAAEQTARSDASRLSLSDAFASGLWNVIGGIYDQLDLPADGLLKHLVLARIALPKSKRATIRYLADNLRLSVGLQTVYDYMDTLNKDNLMAKLLAYARIRAQDRDGTAISVVFYDVTTLYFETDEDDEDTEKSPGLRKKGYSKDHRYDLPQVVVGLTVDNHGFPLDFQVYEGNTYEGQTLLAGVQKIQDKLQLVSNNLTVVADAGMLSQANLEKLESSGYSYIVGARIRSLPAAAAEQILTWEYTKNGNLDTTIAGRRMVVTYSDKRAKRSKQNRERLVSKLQAKLVRGDIVKKSKYVVLEELSSSKNGAKAIVHAIVSDDTYSLVAKTTERQKQQKQPKLTGHLDTEKLEHDARFDGLKGYVTNTGLSATEVVTHYGNLWNVEKSFRMSKSDLRARPTFHYKRERIIAHLTICVCSLGVLRAFEEKLHTSLPAVGLSVALEQLLQIRDYQLKLPNGQMITVQTELTAMQQKLQGR
ncbi:MAG: IS1634 family transposase [Patescibacteria group bacterium]